MLEIGAVGLAVAVELDCMPVFEVSILEVVSSPVGHLCLFVCARTIEISTLVHGKEGNTDSADAPNISAKCCLSSFVG